MFTKRPFADVKGVLLDAVGTAIEPDLAVAMAYAEAARRQGVELDAKVIRERFYQHFGADEIVERRGPLATDEATERRRWRRMVLNCLPEAPDPERAFAELWDYFGRPSSWRVFPDVPPALKCLEEAGLRIGIASNFDGRLRTVLAGMPALSRWAESVAISSEVGYRKPHPAFYHAACERLGLRPEDVVHVGDDPENDAAGPERAGMRAVLLDRSGRFGGQAATVVADLSGLPALLAGVGGLDPSGPGSR